MQKIRKILRAVSEKTALPTNQPTNYYQQHQSYRTLLTPVQKKRLWQRCFPVNFGKISKKTFFTEQPLWTIASDTTKIIHLTGLIL